jgi:SAM-dependent methyltransferase
MIILIVGMHRSGTSMVARGLHAMGANLGERVDTAPDPHNPHGHWEHAEVWQAQERLLIRFGREWHSAPGPLPQRWMEWPDTAATIDLFAGIAGTEVARRGHWLVKDPRSSLLIPLWREVAARIGCELRILRIRRDSSQVAESLLARNAMPHGQALRIWHDHQRSIDRDSEGIPVRAFDHADIMHDPRQAFEAMGVFIGLAGAAERSEDAAALVDVDLWHHRAPGSVGTAHQQQPSADRRPDGSSPDVPTVQVAIVMRTRWRLGMLPRAIRSVLSQSYPNWFLQVVNDGGPPHLVESEIGPYRHLLEGKLGILHIPHQRGMEAASNAGIAAATGDVIAIHDDDDTWHPDFLERMVTFMQREGHDAVVCRSRIVREAWDGGCYVTRTSEEFGPWGDRITAADLAESNRYPPIAFLFRRKLFLQVGPFHEGLPALGDWHFNRRVAAHVDIRVLDETLAHWRLRDPNDRAPNSPPVAHWRIHGFVRAWPAHAPLPEYFSQARQIRIHDLSSIARRFPASVIPIDCWADMSREGEPLLGTGVYLLRIAPKEGQEPAMPETDARPYLQAKCEVGEPIEPVPVHWKRGQAVEMLLNARWPIAAMGLFDPHGRALALEGCVRTFRLTDPIATLGIFASAPRLPDVLCIGAQRAGTTWLHAQLQAHPQVWSSAIKEFHHFDWDGIDEAIGAFRQSVALNAIEGVADRGEAVEEREGSLRRYLQHGFPPSRTWADYAAMFESAPGDKLACDFTPAYATLEESTVAEIVRVMPAVKVIFILRDPVARAVSGAIHSLRRAGIGSPTESQIRSECASSANELRNDYIRTLRMWERHLPPQQMLVIFHDEIAKDPDGVMAQVCDFLGIAPLPPGGVPASQGRSSLNQVQAGVAWPALARVKAHMSRRWLPMLSELEQRYGYPVSEWRSAALARIKAEDARLAGAGADRGHSVDDNLAQWDVNHDWSMEGDEWNRQAEACGVPYADWKAGMIARIASLMKPGGTLVEIGPGHGRWSEALIDHAGLLVLCDISPNCLDACRGRLAGRGRLRTHLSQSADLPKDLTGMVDAVWSYDCLVHVAPEECRRYVTEVARVLRHGGMAVLHHAGRSRFQPTLLDRCMAVVRRALGRSSDQSGPGGAPVGWRSDISRGDVRVWAESAGLEVERQESIWRWNSPRGSLTIGVPRLGDCITVLRKPGPERTVATAAARG